MLDLFYLCFVCVYSGVQHVLTMQVTWRVCYNRQELPTLHEHMCSPPVFWRGPCCT